MHTWTDNPATPAVHVRATHINELRSNVNSARAAAGLSAYNWTDGATLDTTKYIRAVHFTELRSAIQDLWNHANMGSIPNWSVGSPPSTSREVSARAINDLRNWYDLYDPESIIGAQWTNNSRNWNSKSGAAGGRSIRSARVRSLPPSHRRRLAVNRALGDAGFYGLQFDTDEDGEVGRPERELVAPDSGEDALQGYVAMIRVVIVRAGGQKSDYSHSLLGRSIMRHEATNWSVNGR
jgi:hypothetical protein